MWDYFLKQLNINYNGIQCIIMVYNVVIQCIYIYKYKIIYFTKYNHTTDHRLIC